MMYYLGYTFITMVLAFSYRETQTFLDENENVRKNFLPFFVKFIVVFLAFCLFFPIAVGFSISKIVNS
jgi:succinate dehydrogenase/fumarate reductase cytochrome b subunit